MASFHRASSLPAALAALFVFASCSTTVSSGIDGGDGAPAMCGSGTMMCGGTCADVQTDRRNCGMCGHACTGAMICQAATCIACGGAGQPACCSGSQVLCGSGCVDVSTDPMNCGRCGNPCGAGTCVSGVCACAAPLTTCTGGGCVDTTSDPRNCGMCGMRCGGGQTCVASACTCAAPSMTCGGRCTDTTADPRNCGMCGHACAATETCTGSACACRTGLASCGTACVDTTSDPANCGTCGHACADPTPLCSASACIGGMCPTGTMNCGGACTDTRTDPLHCGDCTTTCATDEACIDGNCRRTAPATGCTMCPCAICTTLDIGGCCDATMSGVPPLCVEGGTCPPGYTRP